MSRIGERITVRQAVRMQDETLEEIQRAADGIQWLLRDLPDFKDKNILVETVATQARKIINLAYQMREGYKGE